MGSFFISAKGVYSYVNVLLYQTFYTLIKETKSAVISFYLFPSNCSNTVRLCYLDLLALINHYIYI